LQLYGAVWSMTLEVVVDCGFFLTLSYHVTHVTSSSVDFVLSHSFITV